jgi:hypothetical protein
VGTVGSPPRPGRLSLAERMGMGYQCWLSRPTLASSRLCVGYIMEFEHCGNVDGVIQAEVLEAEEQVSQNG